MNISEVPGRVRPPMWSTGQSSWLQIRRPGFDLRHYQIFWKKKKNSSGSGTGSTQPREYNWGATWQKSSGSCLENREYGRKDPSRWPRGTLYPHKLTITSPTSSGRSVGIVRSQTQTTEFSLVFFTRQSDFWLCKGHSSAVIRYVCGLPRDWNCSLFIVCPEWWGSDIWQNCSGTRGAK
jgi:hypothetical protein